MATTETDAATKQRGKPFFTRENAAENARKANAARSEKKRRREAEAEKLKVEALLTARERAKLRADHLWTQALERLQEVMDGPDPEAALREYWRLFEQGHGKPTQSHEVEAKPSRPFEGMDVAALEAEVSRMEGLIAQQQQGIVEGEARELEGTPSLDTPNA